MIIRLYLGVISVIFDKNVTDRCDKNVKFGEKRPLSWANTIKLRNEAHFAYLGVNEI